VRYPEGLKVRPVGSFVEPFLLSGESRETALGEGMGRMESATLSPANTRGEWAIGNLIDGRYRIVEELPPGAMGLVLRAHDVFLDRDVAIKVVAPEHRSGPALEHLRREARTLAHVHHENIVEVYAFGFHAGTYFFAMEHITGRDLATIIEEENAKGSRLATAQAVDIIAQIGRGLANVHAGGLVHRDVKPSNIVIENATGRPVLIDFGLARRRGERPSLIGGTPWYMAPEQLNATCALSWRLDLYGLACTAFELLSGQPAFSGEDAYEASRARLEHPPPRLSSIGSNLAPFDRPISRAMATNPLDRQGSIHEFVKELEAAARQHARPGGPPRTNTIRHVCPPASMKPGNAEAPSTVDVLVLERSEAARSIIRTIDRALSLAGDHPRIHRVETPVDLIQSFARSPADIVVIDDESAGGLSECLIEGLRHAPNGGAEAQIVVLKKYFDQASRAAEFGAREIPKPLNVQVLASIMSQMATLITNRRTQRTSEDATPLAPPVLSRLRPTLPLSTLLPPPISGTFTRLHNAAKTTNVGASRRSKGKREG
jgi:eukaryotic-like serine/threonine-protein kinase